MRDENDFHYYFKFKKKIDNFDDLWRMKKTGRLALREWMITFPYEQELANVIANACSELIENCIKYSVVNTAAQVEIFAIRENVYVETINIADEAQILKIKETLKLIEANMDDLVDLYLKKIKKAQDTGKSQLGLIKIIMETQGRLSIIEEAEKGILHLQLKMLRHQPTPSLTGEG